MVSIAGVLLGAVGCGQPTANKIDSQELAALRQDNEEVQRLRRENAELPRLRKQNQEMQLLRGLPQQLAQLRQENNQLRTQLASLPPGSAPPPPPPGQEPPAPLQPIVNLVQAFDEAAAALPEAADEKDRPLEGDRIEIDQSVIGLLIPDFATNQNTSGYEMSGWLKSKGVVLRNYQQFNLLGITNYKVLRADPAK